MSAQRCSVKLPVPALRTGCPAHEIMAVLGHKASRRPCGLRIIFLRIGFRSPR
jgi:hypothetical protein